MELRRLGIADTSVLSAVEKIPREKFVPLSFQDQSYENKALPIECGQTISQPYIVSKMTEALDVDKKMKVLEIGTGSGYQAAILSVLSRRVYSIERHKDLYKQANLLFKELNLSNITTLNGNGYQGWKAQAPFDRIMVTAAATTIPEALIDQLSIGGILVAPIGTVDQFLFKIIKKESGFETIRMDMVKFVPLIENDEG